MIGTVIDAIMDRLDPLPSERSWADVDTSSTVCMECGKDSKIRSEWLLTRHVTCSNPGCENTDGYVFRPLKLPVVSGVMGLFGAATAFVTGYPDLWILGAGGGMLLSLYRGTATLARWGGL